jgi:hypothetical protein
MAELDHDYVEGKEMLDDFANAMYGELREYYDRMEKEHEDEDDAWLEDYIKHGQ